MDATVIAVVTLAAVWGAATGLLIPRAAYRFSVEPEEEWRDTCPAGHPLRGPGPSRGWLGTTSCPACTASVPAVASPYAPRVLVTVVTALACAASAAATGARPELVVQLLIAPVAVLLATVDHRVHRLPDVLTLPLAVAAAALLGVASLLPGHDGSWSGALLGGAALGGFYLVLHLINPNGMGRGDVKLALSLGVVLGWYGWPVLFAGGFAGFLYGTLYGLGLLVLRRANRRTGIPFGPFMIAGALTGVVLGAL